MIGRVLGISFGRDGKPRMLLELDTEPSEIPEGKVDITLKRHREGRSLDANAYYWVLVGKIAEALRGEGDAISNAEVHQRQLQKYGCFEVDESGAAKWIVLPDGRPFPEGIYLLDSGHIVKLKSKKGEVIGRVYIQLRGSHTYNTKEMSCLIDGTIEDAKALGIETISPNEKKRMMEAWDEKHPTE